MGEAVWEDPDAATNAKIARTATIVSSIRVERDEQLKLALRLRGEGYTYKEIGIRVPVTVKNGNARFDKPHTRSVENVRQFLHEAVRKFIPEESREEILEALRIG